ncbi:MAG: LruC domain-containing protein [Saprospiraceae bacterium]
MPDHLDAFPEDDERAYVSFSPGENNYGTIAFEDLWPRKGDYDFNDMVINYSFIETLDAQNSVKDIQIKMEVAAMGASQNHGFAIRLPISPQLVESISGQVITDNYFDLNSNGTESGMSMAVVPVFTDGFSLFESVETGGIVNTDPARPWVNPGNLDIKITFISPIEREFIGYAPYDPFMLRKQDRSLEIHLAGYSPTERADISLFNTGDDKSDLANGFCYVDSRNLPWAIHVPETFIYPKERIPITEVYENFATWATFGGESVPDWFRNTGSNVNGSKGY